MTRATFPAAPRERCLPGARTSAGSPAWATRQGWTKGQSDFRLGDVRDVTAGQLPAGLELATSSFPCVDLSLAGNRRGLLGQQSGMFWEFARILRELGEGRPRVVLLENVVGFASSHGGKDLADALAELGRLGYSSDVFTVDARHFVPQSRPRMFLVGIRGPLPPVAACGVPPLSDVRPERVRRIHSQHHDGVAA